MALFAPSESPAVVIKEIDLTGVVPSVQSTTGAIVGNFRWGPVEKPTLVDGEATLASTFGTPTRDSEATDYLSAAYFLKYSNSLYVTRTGTSALENAVAVTGQTAVLVKNADDWNDQQGDLAANHTFVARYPGALGNSLAVHWFTYTGAGNDSDFNAWAYANSFDGPPTSSSFASNEGSANDEIHIAVVDEDGLLTGTAGKIVETFPFLSRASNAKMSEGGSNYLVDVINTRSSYIWCAAGLATEFGTDTGTTTTATADFADAVLNGAQEVSLTSGADTAAMTSTEYNTGYDLYADAEGLTIDFLIAPGIDDETDADTIIDNMVAVAEGRKDCVVIASPIKSDVVGVAPATATTNVVSAANNLTNSSYLFLDNNHLYVYDKYNDKYRWIPAASSTAGLMAATDTNYAPWFSPAGEKRGKYLGVTKLAFNPNKSQRDTLYKASVNPIANLPGAGILLYGDKTKLNRPSAFDRINVRRLFIVLERAIGAAARNSLFEFNDEFTRAEFVNIVEPALRNVQGRRGITDFRVVCDETNNTPDVIDRNEFIASIFIKPARAINYITLNFVATRTGVDFDEVVGTV